MKSLRDYINLLSEDTLTNEGIAGKLAGKAIPGVGLALGAADAFERWKQGDYKGAAISGASGLASLVPGVGTAASVGLDAYNAYRDSEPVTAEDIPAQSQAPLDPNLEAFFAELQKMGGSITGEPGQEMITLPGQQPVPLAQLGQISEAGMGSVFKSLYGKLPGLWNNFVRGSKGALPAATQGPGGRFAAPSAANKAAWKTGKVATKGAKYAGAAAGAAGVASMSSDTQPSQVPQPGGGAHRAASKATTPVTSKKTAVSPQAASNRKAGKPDWYEPEDYARDQRIQQLLHPQGAPSAKQAAPDLNQATSRLKAASKKLDMLQSPGNPAMYEGELSDILTLANLNKNNHN